ncbi:MGMT family protein [Vibrio sp. ZSDE26]|uniref:MGMT family protein n=1 Tax=Vibrio amylolyticus TaxID=2847292 RepID=A0A9X1XIZ9_9VIBR|nr:MGMT family protein [Vibrio amylolyticus]MCK6262713.1 MGMT family protein [Vibrio amylolyticus]
MDQFSVQIFAVIHQIPQGKVTSYGVVAKLAGYPGYARQVGRVLSNLPRDTQLPWHRVVNSQGQISLQGESLQRQKERLLVEGIEVSGKGKIRLKLYQWQP